MKHDMIGEVDLFGLDEFGQPVGLNPLWGAAVGGGVATATALAIQSQAPANWAKHSEALGFLVGAAASGGMLAFPATRAAGWAGLATAALTSGIRAVAKKFLGSNDGLGYATISALPPLAGAGLGLPMLQPLQGAGLGMATVYDAPPAYGIAGPQLGSGAPVDLIGQSAGSDQVSLMGGPSTSNLASAYGATLFGR